MGTEDAKMEMGIYNPSYTPSFSLYSDANPIMSAHSSQVSKFSKKTLSFLNDIALGKYTVLSETKNIFTEQIELATY